MHPGMFRYVNIPSSDGILTYPINRYDLCFITGLIIHPCFQVLVTIVFTVYRNDVCKFLVYSVCPC